MTGFDFWMALALVIFTVTAAVIAVLWIAGCAWLTVLLSNRPGVEAALAEQRAKIEALGKSGAVDPAAVEVIINSVYPS